MSQRVILKIVVLVRKWLHGVTAAFFKSYASHWIASKVVHSYDLQRLVASSYQLDNGASLSLSRQCGTVCHQHCITTVCHWTLSNRSWKLTIQTVTNITWCFFCNYSHRDISVAFEVSNNKYFIVGLQARMVHGCRLLSEKFGLFYLVTVGLILSKL